MTIGSRVGAYEITGTLGAGGMGEVYRARDTRLQRDVALKILPDAVVDDPERLARFRREAQLLAALNHPNIAQVYGIEQADGAPPAIAMELVPGVTLEELVHGSEARTDPRGRGLPPTEVLAIGRQIAAALEAAHETGIVHRDLKPANIKIRDDGVVKVLDFGLAKADESRSAAGDVVARAATVTSPAMTAVAQILGTAAYMAPEQARGRAVDKRADVWAFGVVLFELLTGERLFGSGQSVTETLASVLKDEIDLRRLPANTPRALGHLIGRCLERDPQQRLRDIGEARILLSKPLAEDSVGTSGTARRGRQVPALAALAGAAVLAAAAAAIVWVARTPEAPRLRQLDLAVPPGFREAAISNDATRVAYLADNQLFVRRFDELEPHTLGPMHVTARQLVWAPDDRAIAFVADSRIYTVPTTGGSPFVVTRIPRSGRVMGVAWLPDDTIAFSVWRDSLYAVPATGGTAEIRLAIDAAAEIDFHGIAPLPDGRLIVSTHRRGEDADIVELVSTGETPRRTVVSRDPDLRLVRMSTSGARDELLFVREGTNTGLWRVPFEKDATDFNRAALLVDRAADYSVARDGTVLAVIPPRQRRTFAWVDLRGAETAVPGDEIEGPARDLELSPDDRRVAFVRGGFLTAGAGIGSLSEGVIAVRDLHTGDDQRLTTSAASSGWASIGSPTWSSDGQRLIHRTGRVEGSSLVEIRADIAGSARRLAQGLLGRLMPDGRTLIFTAEDRGVGRLSRVTIGTDGQPGSVEALFPGQDVAPRVGEFDISADGRLIALVQYRQGERGDVYIAELDRPADLFLVQEGARYPRFTGDGRHLFLVRGREDPAGRPVGELARVPLSVRPRLSLGPVEGLLPIRPDGPMLATYDVVSDGTRVLAFKNAAPRPEDSRRLVLVERR
jgi:tRNA A-37 threonylcarbamoyl transferase component Bud32